ncbi:MAG: DUF308 domain-containing protein [Candidatus Coprovivens sp.]
MDKIVERYYKMMNISVFMYIFDIIVGALLIYYADLAIKIYAVVLGSLMLIHGLFDLIRYLYDGLGNRIFNSDVTMAVSSIIFGLFTIFYTFESINLIGVIFGIWLIVYSFQKSYYLFVLVKNNEEIFPLVGFITLLDFIMGVLVIINPFDSFIIVTKLIGYFSIASSLLNVMYCLLFKKRAKQLLKMFE